MAAASLATIMPRCVNFGPISLPSPPKLDLSVRLSRA
jgi:hypothetical protein